MAFTISYNANGATGGTVPTDGTNYTAGQSANIQGPSGLVKGGETFCYWNTAANDSAQSWLPGFSLKVNNNITFYAQWATTAGLTGGGSTTHYNFSYDASLPTAAGQTVAQDLVANAESDFNVMNGWFGNIGLPSTISLIVGNGQNGTYAAGAAWSGNTVALFMSGSTSGDYARYLVTSEVTEKFMAAKGNGWGYSGVDGNEGIKGEGLSRFLGWQMIQQQGLSQASAGGYFVSNDWLNSPRVDYVNSTSDPNDNAPDAATGCTTLFIYYLFSQLKFTIPTIISNGATTLAGVYNKLTGDNGDPFPFFARLVGQSFPGTNQITAGPNLDDPFPLGLLSFWANTNTFSRDQVKDLVLTKGGIASNAFYLMLEGFSIDAFNAWGVKVPTPSFEAGVSGVSIQPSPATPGGPVPAQAIPEFEDPSNTKAPQRIRFSFDLKFTDESAFPANPGDPPTTAVLDGAANISGNPLSGASCKGGFEFLAGANPYFSNLDSTNQADLPYLSRDLRVFRITAGLSPLPGAPAFTSDAYASIQSLIGWLNGATAYTKPTTGPDPLDALPYQNGYETADSSVTPTDGSGHTTYNFALARVRLQGTALDKAAACRVFFRLFVGQSADTDFQPSTTYKSTQGSSGADSGHPVFPLASATGLSDPGGNSLQTIPFFATDKTGAHDYDGAVGNANIRYVQIPSGEDQVWAYYGCFLDLYDAAGNAQNLAGTHHCVVAEIAYDDAPIPTSTPTGAVPNPLTWDQLAQRNLQITLSENPKSRATHVVPQAFDLRPSRVPIPLPGTLLDLPDELMIDWGKTPAGSEATIYWPGLEAHKVIALANSVYASHLLRADGPHTIACTTTKGVTYIPVPHVAGVNFAGLFTVDLPPSIKHGQVFDILVRRVSTRQGRIAPPPPPPPRIAIAETAAGPSRARRLKAGVVEGETFTWRQTLGSFSVRIPVTDRTVMLPLEEDTLAILKWRLAHKPAPYRWRPVWERMIELVSARVAGLGGDPEKIPPSLGGYPGKGRPPEPRPEPRPRRDDIDVAVGKVEGVVYDRFGDFAGFDLRTEQGGRRRFESREDEIEELILRAWRERMVIGVLYDDDGAEAARPIRITLMRAPD